MDFLIQLQNAVGREPKHDILRNFVNILIEKRYQIAGHKISQFEDSRYKVLRDFVKNHVPNNSEIKVITINIQAQIIIINRIIIVNFLFTLHLLFFNK
jgi:citrate synthase